MAEQTKKKVGRPKKVQTPTPEPVTEQRKTLVMSSGPTPEKPTLALVQKNLNNFYTKLLGCNNGAGWFDFGNGLNSFNPFLQNQRLKQISVLPAEMDKEDIISALKAPQNSEISLRQAGASLASSQYLYYKILRLAADVPMYLHYKTPEFLDNTSEYKKEEFVNEDKYVDEWIETFDIVNTLKRTALEVKREGKVSYLLRNGISKGEKGQKIVDFCTWQKLPNKYVKLTAIGTHGYIASFNLMIFMQPGFMPEQYPEYIQKIWASMINDGVITKDKCQRLQVNLGPLMKFSYTNEKGINTKGVFESCNNQYMYWVQLPQDLCYTFASDSSVPWAIPDTAGLFLGLQELTDYGTLAGLIASTPLTSILTGEAEMVDNPNPGEDQTVLAPETIAGFQNQFNNMTSTNTEALFVPFKNLKLQSLPNIPNSNEIVTKAVQNFISTAGEGGIITATDKPSVAQVKGAQLMEEAQHNFVTKQFESVLNMIINNLIGCKYKWKLHLWGGIFTFDAEMKRDKEMWTGGATFLLPKIASAYGMNVRDIGAVVNYIDSLGIYKKFETLTQEKQAEQAKAKATVENKQKEPNTVKKVGRPSADENEIENDNTEKSIDQGTNTGDMRDYAMYSQIQGKCLICGETISQGILCEDCREEFEEVE